MFHIVLYEPEIPPNTGNIIRLCANSGAMLHLIHPLGFSLDEKQLRRAGLDYHDLTNLHEHSSLDSFLQTTRPRQLYACSTKGRRCYAEARFQPGDALLFGPESRGLPAQILTQSPDSQVLRIPMSADNRSLNLSNTVAIVLFEAWRQQGFAGSADYPA
ncbi:MAG: tRNA (uridine(34)/cytosine(34)/5-carboxymethylaminomethyluridine(34)-2'-O)-methyltransferase TrmL [Gammaproteobacteria bacterium]|nr:tRNA (uridine(34)/cytosine(34)/5-carboxymethylaminomethyluridine(34)-2'-O)-methyltransferase TrmL [Gammaproteobacteria bacterium]